VVSGIKARPVRKPFEYLTVTVPNGLAVTVAFFRLSMQLARRAISSPAGTVLGLASTNGVGAGEALGLGATSEVSADAGVAVRSGTDMPSASAAMAAGTDVRMGIPSLRPERDRERRVWVIFAPSQ
jgi:hypothetical protein